MGMNTKKTSWDETLLEYLDGSLPPDKLEMVKETLVRSAELSNRLEELKEIVTLLNQTNTDQPSKNFTLQVMQNLGHYAANRQLPIRNGILLLMGVIVAIILSMVLLGSGLFDAPGTINLNEFVTEPKIITQPLPSISLDGKLLVNGIILMNMALAFLIIDRVIFRPWLERRAHEHHEMT
ncbi:MAG: hypothetical protein MUE95_04710 [Cyclobacteriaceae bacterium]|jgi:hypothetical protein|nr:hypothetical protein [Cyclobacteriaceae bacterium]